MVRHPSKQDLPTFWIAGSTEGQGSPAPGIRPLWLGEAGQVSLGDYLPVGGNPMYLAWLPPREGTPWSHLAISHERARGEISTHRIGDPGTSTQISRVGTESADPCYIAADESTAVLLCANYSGGALSVHPYTAEGVSAPVLLVHYEGSGPVADRQEASHPHQAVIDPARESVLVPDLGADVVHVHRLEDLLSGRPDHRDIRLRPGSGPRHLVITGSHALVVGELDRTVTVIDLSTSQVTAVVPSTLRPGPPEAPGPSAIRLTGNGWVLVGNRGPNTIGVLRWEADAAEVRFVAEYDSGGDHARDLALSADERFVLVANQFSDSLVVLELDDETGRLSTVASVSTPSPACLVTV